MAITGVAGKRRFLDLWARALGVGNDLEAMAKLRAVMNELDDARSQLQKTTRVLASVPDPDANVGATGAMDALESTWRNLLAVERRFAKHERGRK
ncbi:hypothetical protein [Kribbella soli]|uniref:Uncharacterized protein n=1 Tax=Kribbella soli TaxID=1124743 RepID=A0A4R0HPQ1_9ACTN|nr:hypothetical protein [Kribbella soli]TCC11272.1 hypothetical protein E0H45_08285 [Kribbella soli]